MSVLQIKIDDKSILKELERKAKAKGLSMTSYARMKLYEDINAPILDIEEGLRDIEKGQVSPGFENVEDAMKWLKS